MRRIIPILFVLGTIFVIQYEGHYWNPCENGACYAINCGLEGCYSPGRTVWCEDTECVEKELNESGVEHLDGVYRVNLTDTQAVTKMDVKRTFTIHEPQKE